MTFASRLLAGAIGVIFPGAGLLQANAIAVSMGTLDVRTSTSIFLPTTAPGDACLTAEVNGVVTSANLYGGSYGAPVGCRNQILVKSNPQPPSIFFTYYDLKTYQGYQGNT